MVHHHELECHAKKWDSIFKVKVTVWAYIIKIWQFLLYLLLVLNQWVFCNQTQFECKIIISKEVSSENVGLLCSRSMSQPRLKVSVNVSLDYVLCITEPFVTKPSMVRHHYKPEHHMWKIGFYLQCQGHSNWILVHTIKYDYFYYMFGTADYLGRPT